MHESSAWERAAERLNVSNKPCFPGKRNKHAGASASTCADNFSEQFPVLCTGLVWQLSALICRRRRIDWGDEALENDELEGRQGLRARVIHRIKEFRRLGLGVIIKGTLFTLLGLAEGPAGTRDGEGGGQEETAEEHRVGIAAPANCARLCWKDGAAQGRDSSFRGACRQARAAGMPRGHVRAALQTSKSHLADKNLFGPPRYSSVCPPSPAHPFPALQAPQRYRAAPVVTLFTTHGRLAGKLAHSNLLSPRNGPQM